MEPIQETIAKNLLQIRKSRHLSLDKVAELTGVSKAMLAQIEKGRSNPTVTTLWKIANGLQVSFSTFMKEEDRPQVTKIKLNEIAPVNDENGNYLVYSIFPFHPDKKFEIYKVDIQPGYRHTSESHFGEEYILIKNGVLEIEIQGNPFTLTENEVMTFSANSEHTYINSTDKVVSFYNVIFYPS
ncbi:MULTISPECIES: helix-turn-helix domain-containing protein [Bacillus]|uniref:helix-turn-helix domain-containing protein n=1 Tax=Bacillus TaxID=1386 RepID=UPI000303F440|nr:MULTISPECIES: XRE family transcriptional regulator [Bacillus]